MAINIKATRINRQLIPAKNIIKIPDIIIKIAVPKSGCIATNKVGTPIIAKVCKVVLTGGGQPSR